MGGPGVGLERCPPLWWCWTPGPCTVPCYCSWPPSFAPGSSEVVMGFWSLGILLFRICPNCTCTQLFFVPYRFFVFCRWRRHLSWCKLCSRGSKVPACLTGTTMPAPTARSLCSSTQPPCNSAGASSPRLWVHVTSSNVHLPDPPGVGCLLLGHPFKVGMSMHSVVGRRQRKQIAGTLQIITGKDVIIFKKKKPPTALSLLETPLRTLLHCWWGCKLVEPLWRTVWRFLRKLEIELPYDPAIPLLGIHTE